MKTLIFMLITLVSCLGSLNAQLVESNSEFNLKIVELDKEATESPDLYLARMSSNKTPHKIEIRYDGNEVINILDYEEGGHSVAYCSLRDKNKMPEWLKRALHNGEYHKIYKSLYIKSENDTFSFLNINDITNVKVNFVPRALEVVSIARLIDGFRARQISGAIKLDKTLKEKIASALSKNVLDEYGLPVKKQHPFKISVICKNESIVKGDCVIIDVTLTNTSGKDLFFCKRGTPFDHPKFLMSNIFYILMNGKRVEYIGRQVKRGPVDVSEMVSIQAGQMLKTSLTLSDDYNLGSAGVYYITYNSNLPYFSDKNDISGLDIFNRFIMHSKTIEVSVKPPASYIDTGSFTMKLKQHNKNLLEKIKKDSESVEAFTESRYIVQLKAPFNTRQYIEELEKQFPGTIDYIVDFPIIKQDSNE